MTEAEMKRAVEQGFYGPGNEKMKQAAEQQKPVKKALNPKKKPARKRRP